MTGFWDDAEVISTYTRAQAIEDGVLVDVSETAKEAGFKVPVAVTAGVWALIEPTEQEKQLGQDPVGRLWDAVWMAFLAVRSARSNGPELLYDVLFLEAGRNRGGWEHVTERLKLHSGPGDDGEHVITIMLPNED